MDIYQLTESGVIHLPTGTMITQHGAQWHSYLQWVDGGGIARPMSPANMRKPVWDNTMLVWIETEDPAETSSRAARNAGRGRLREVHSTGSINAPHTQAGLLIDIIAALDRAGLLTNE